MNNKMKVMFGLMSATICSLIINMISDRQAYANTATNMNDGGKGTFVAATININTDTSGFEILHAADFNQDGLDDLLIYNEPINGGEKSFRIYLNEGKTFTAVWELTESDCDCPDFSTNSFIPAYVDNDEYPDIISAPKSGHLLVYINQLGTGLACNGDLNDDGTVNVTDLLVLIEDWGDCS